jgi:hypothetical protein
VSYQQDYKSQFNEQSRDERAEPQEQKTKTLGGGGDKSGDDKLLEQIRTDYKFCLDYWSYNRDQMADDMRFVVNKPWTQDEIQKREGRPCLAPDEISQYLKQCTNNYRQNKREGKVIPRGEGASDKDAERREAIIRGIQYQSNAQAAHTTAFEAAVETSMGFWALTTRSVPNGKGLAVEPRIRRIPNQFTVLLDPEALESDFSDQNICFVTSIYRKTAFAARFPNATKTSFSTEDEKMAPDWFKADSVVVAEYWQRKSKTRKKLKIDTEAGPTDVYEDELHPDDKPEILSAEEETEHTVVQYLTNGVEILEERPWPGSWIPVIPVVGEEKYEQDGAGQSKRVFISLTRRMKVPQKMLCFIASQEAEEFSMAPRSPLLLWAGQEQADKKSLENLHIIPRAFVLLKRNTDSAGQDDLPGGGRLPFQPNAQAYEISREAWRRSIQAAAGITPLPTAAQRQNEKSGVALEKIQTQESVGSYHFTDNMDRALENEARQLNELITKVMDTPRTVSIRNADETHSTLKVGAAEHMGKYLQQEQAQGDAPMPEGGDDYLITDRGEWDVTVTTGPDYQSQRDEASQFADHMIEMAPTLGMPPQTVAKLVALAVKMKDVGNIGDQMAKIIDPEDQTGAQLQQAQMQLAQQQQAAQEMQAEIQKLKLEQAGKVIQGETQKQIAQINNDIKVLVAEIQAKSQDAAQRAQMYQEFWVENHGAAHEIAMQKDQQSHDAQQAQAQAVQAAQSQAAEHSQQQVMAAQQQQTQPEGQA